MLAAMNHIQEFKRKSPDTTTEIVNSIFLRKELWIRSSEDQSMRLEK